MKTTEGSEPWSNPNMSAQLPTYAEAMRSGTPYPPVQPGQQDYPPTTAPYPTTNPPYPVSNPTGHPVPAYPTQAPYPIHNVPGYPRAPEYTSYPQSEPTAGQYVIDQQYQTTPVISHPVTHVQHIVTSAPGSNDCCCGTRRRSTGIVFGIILALIFLAIIVRLNSRGW